MDSLERRKTTTSLCMTRRKQQMHRQPDLISKEKWCWRRETEGVELPSMKRGKEWLGRSCAIEEKKVSLFIPVEASHHCNADIIQGTECRAMNRRSARNDINTLRESNVSNSSGNAISSKDGKISSSVTEKHWKRHEKSKLKGDTFFFLLNSEKRLDIRIRFLTKSGFFGCPRFSMSFPSPSVQIHSKEW